MCLPRLLVFVYESNIWTFEEIKQILFRKTQRDNKALPQFDAMSRLLETRDSRLTSKTTLKILLERFTDSKCSEMRDRVFALLGLARDVRPFTTSNGMTSNEDEYISSLDMQFQTLPESQRSPGAIRVDYSRPFYDIWTDIVKFVYFRAPSLDNWVFDTYSIQRE